MQFTLKNKIEIILLFNQKMLQVKSARKFKISQNTVSKIVKNMKEKGTVERTKGCCRKKKLQANDITTLLKINKKTLKHH